MAAAVLTLADMLCRTTPEPIIIEPDDRQTYGVKEAAELLHTSSKKVYLMCLAGKLRCVRIGGRVRIPIDEIERFEMAPAQLPQPWLPETTNENDPADPRRGCDGGDYLNSDTTT